MLILVIGDFHIPHRAYDIPTKFKNLLVPGKIQEIICVGNLCNRETFDWLKTISRDISVVKGDFDETLRENVPEHLVLVRGGFRVGVVHGHQLVPQGDAMALGQMRRRLDADVLISGHTHEQRVFQEADYLYINPGSATGAYTASQSETNPTFVLMDVQQDSIIIYSYQLVSNDVKVTRKDFKKKQ